MRELPADRIWIVRGDEQVEVADRLAGASQASGDLRAKDARHRAKCRQQGIGQDPTFGKEPAALGALEHGDPPEDVLLRFGLDAPHEEQPMRLRRLLQRIDAEDAERVVDVLGRSGSQARNPGQLEQRRRDLALEPSQEFQPSGGHEFDDLFLHRLPDARNVLEPPVLDQVLDLGGQVVELPDSLAVGADLEEVLTLDLEQVGHPVEHGCNVGIPHVANLAGMPLSGVRVVDLSRLLPGAYCTQLLQAQGAQVTKLEPPAGDPIRRLPGGEAYFDALHRGQQVLALDLRTATGRQAPFLIAAALAGRAQTGRGSRVEVSMTSLMHSWTALPRAALKAGVAGLPLTGELPCYHVYSVRDGHLTVAALEPDFWQAFCRAIGRDDLASRQFDSSAVDQVQTILAPARLDEWMARFGDGDVCVEPVVGLADANED